MARAPLLILLGLVAVGGPASAQSRVATNLITHSEVAIDMPVARGR